MPSSKKKVTPRIQPIAASPSDAWTRKTITISLSAERRALLRSVLPEEADGSLSPADVIYHLIDLLESHEDQPKLPVSQITSDERLVRLEQATKQNSEALALCAGSLKQIALSMEPLHKLMAPQSSAPAPKPSSSWMNQVVAILRPAPKEDIQLSLKLASMTPHDADTVRISFEVEAPKGVSVSLPALRLRPMSAKAPLVVALQNKPIPHLRLSCKKDTNGWRAVVRMPPPSGTSLLELLL